MSHCSGGTVELMFSMKNEEHIQCLDQFWMRAVIFFAEMVHHVEEIFSVSESVLGLIVGTTDTVSVTGSGDGGDFSKNTEDLLVAQLFVLNKDALTGKGWVGV